MQTKNRLSGKIGAIGIDLKAEWLFTSCIRKSILTNIVHRELKKKSTQLRI